MGLETTFRNAARTAFSVFKDAVVSVRVETVATVVYDASAGVVSAIAHSSMSTAIFQRVERRLVDGERIKPTDVQVLVLPQFSFAPKPDDTLHAVESNASVSYRIISSDIDPMGALYTFVLRRNG